MVMTMVTLERRAVKHIKASEFKAKCLKLMDEVQATGEEIVVTKNGTAVAKLVAIPKRGGRFYFGVGKGRLEITGDLVNLPPVTWDFDRWPKDRLTKPKPKSSSGAKGKHVVTR